MIGSVECVSEAQVGGDGGEMHPRLTYPLTLQKVAEER